MVKIEIDRVQKMLEWLKRKLYLDSITQNASSRAVKRGQVYRCDFGCGIGSEMQKERPAVIVQNNDHTKKSFLGVVKILLFFQTEGTQEGFLFSLNYWFLKAWCEKH